VLSSEHFRKTGENFIFFSNLLARLQEHTQGIPQLRLIDYGAGTLLYRSSIFAGLHHDQQPVVAYDPSVDLTTTKLGNNIIWTNIKPTGIAFDVVVCHFSLHHISNQLEETINKFTLFDPRFIVIADYDYTDASLDDFANSFISQQELRELEEGFDGDIQVCFDFHRQFGAQSIIKALSVNNYQILCHQYGAGIAKYKFFIIAGKN
jgi:hypothetical protein